MIGLPRSEHFDSKTFLVLCGNVLDVHEQEKPFDTSNVDEPVVVLARIGASKRDVLAALEYATEWVTNPPDPERDPFPGEAFDED